MGGFGDLAPFGLLSFGDTATTAEAIYDSLQAGSKAAFDVSVGTHVEASNFARALTVAAARETMMMGAGQRRPQEATVALPDLEDQYGIVPSPSDSLIARRAAIVAKKIIQRGSRPEALITAMTALIGTNFWKVRSVSPSEVVATASPGTKGAWTDPARPHFFWRLKRSVPATGVPFTVAIEALGQDTSELPNVDDVLCVQPENQGLAEAITISAVDTVNKTITATFAYAHDDGASLVTHAPVYSSSQRTLLVAVKSVAATNPTTLSRIRDLLFRICRGTTLPIVVVSADGVTAGPLMADGTPWEITPVGTVTL